MACAQASTTLSLLKRDLRKHATASRERLSRLVNIRSADAEELRELLTGNIVKLLVTGYGPYVDSDGSPLTPSPDKLFVVGLTSPRREAPWQPSRTDAPRSRAFPSVKKFLIGRTHFEAAAHRGY